MQHNFQNVLALHQLKILGYPLVNIRKAFHKLTGIGQPELAKMLGESRQNITLHIGGIRSKRAIQEGIAEIYHVPVEEFFDGPSTGHPTKRLSTGSGPFGRSNGSRSNGAQKNNTH